MLGPFIACLIAAPVLGFLYADMFAYGPRLAIAVHLAVVFFFVAALFHRHLRSFLLFAVVFVIPMQVDYHLLYRPFTRQFESPPFAAGIRVDAVDVVLFLLYAAWLLDAATRKERGRLTFGHPIGTLLLGWVLLGLVSSAFTAAHFEYSVYETFFLLKGVMLYFFLINNIRGESDFRIVVAGLVAGAVGEGAYMIAQYATGLNYTLKGEFHGIRGPEGFRSAGFSGGADAACQMMSYALNIAVAYFYIATKRSYRALTFAAIACIVPGILATKFRAAGAAAAVGVMLVLFMGYVRRWISGVQILKAAVGVILFVSVISPALIYRFQVGEYGEVRVPLMATAARMARDNWLLGVGAGNYMFNVEKYLPYKLRESWVHVVHNEYLRMLAERGLLGALVYYTLVTLAAVQFWRCRGSPDRLIMAVSTALFTALVASIYGRFFGIYYQPVWYQFFCVLLALAVWMTAFERRRESQTDALSRR
ncbi:MAG: O-antigen ligase family protein [Desulfomonile sp.]|nr:O-antigen ligase family protein [Desulfomonile sp.]